MPPLRGSWATLRIRPAVLMVRHYVKSARAGPGREALKQVDLVGRVNRATEPTARTRYIRRLGVQTLGGDNDVVDCLAL